MSDSEYTNEDYNDLLIKLIDYVASQFNEDNTFDDARFYAEGAFEHDDRIAEMYRDALDREYKKIDDAETKRVWKILEGPQGAVNFGEEQLAELTGEENEEPFDIATLHALQVAWQNYFERNAGAQLYELVWLTDEQRRSGTDRVFVETLDDEMLFGYDGKYIWFNLPRSDQEIADDLRKNKESFKPNEDLQELLDHYNLVWQEVFDWLPDGAYDSEKYIPPYGMYGAEGLWYITIDQDALWRLIDDAIGDDEWLAEALDVSEYDEETLEAWRAILLGGEDAKPESLRKLLRGTPEEERIMGFETDQGDFEFWDLKNSAAIKAHGSKMGQCVGNRQYGYIPAVERGEAKIIAMRTKSGKPKFTLEAYLDGNGDIVKFGEIKGKANRIPGFQSMDPSKGKFKPVEVEVILAFADELDPPVNLYEDENEDMQPALNRMMVQTLKDHFDDVVDILEGHEESTRKLYEVAEREGKWTTIHDLLVNAGVLSERDMIPRQLKTRRNPQYDAFERGFEWGR
jgi:hypothetical protein